jgi:hypothetical protein
MLSQHPLRTQFEKTSAHPGRQRSPWGHTRRQVRYLLEQVVAAEAGAIVAAIMPDAPRNMIASESLRMIAFPAL